MSNATSLLIGIDVLKSLLDARDFSVVHAELFDESTLLLRLEGKDVPAAPFSVVEITSAELTSDNRYMPTKARIAPVVSTFRHAVKP